jgi:hypothetical protein
MSQKNDKKSDVKSGEPAAYRYPFGELTVGSAPPLWQTEPLVDRSPPPWHIAVCRGDWLIIGYGNADATVAAVDVRGPPSERKLSAQTALSAVGAGMAATDYLELLDCSVDGVLSAVMKTETYMYRVMLLNTMVTVDAVTGVRALTFAVCTVIPGIELAGDLAACNVFAGWGPPLCPGESAALYIVDFAGVKARLSLFVDGRRRWSCNEAALSGFIAVARDKVIGGVWRDDSRSPWLVVLDAKTGGRSHDVSDGVISDCGGSTLAGRISRMAVVDDEFLIVLDGYGHTHVLLLDDVVAVPPPAARQRAVAREEE